MNLNRRSIFGMLGLGTAAVAVSGPAALATEQKPRGAKIGEFYGYAEPCLLDMDGDRLVSAEEWLRCQTAQWDPRADDSWHIGVTRNGDRTAAVSVQLRGGIYYIRSNLSSGYNGGANFVAFSIAKSRDKHGVGVASVAVDPFDTVLFSAVSEAGLPVVEARGGWASQSPAIREIQRAFSDGVAQHNEDIELARHLNGCALRVDAFGNIAADLRNSTGPVEGAVALIAAFQAVLRAGVA